MADANGTVIERLALIGNFLPRQCGLATFTTDVYTAMRDRFPELAVDVYAMDDHRCTPSWKSPRSMSAG